MNTIRIITSEILVVAIRVVASLVIACRYTLTVLHALGNAMTEALEVLPAVESWVASAVQKLSELEVWLRHWGRPPVGA